MTDTMHCYFDDTKYCDYKEGLWQCRTCKEWFCHYHWHETSLGRNVECATCEHNRSYPHDAYEILLNAAAEAGWDMESMLIHACGYINNRQSWEAFQDYVDQVVQEEIASSEGWCESCGQPCEYDTDMCLCDDCRVQLPIRRE